MGIGFGLSVPVHAQDVKPVTVAILNVTGGEAGQLLLTAAPKGVLGEIEVSGLTPGWHGVHLHATGDCSDHADHFKKSGGHAASEGQVHGFLAEKGPHMGDVPNIWVHADGTGKSSFFSTLAKMDDLLDADGAAIMIHAAPDDYRADPSGNSGDRIACGVIKP